jgi:hypothetical protein
MGVFFLVFVIGVGFQLEFIWEKRQRFGYFFGFFPKRKNRGEKYQKEIDRELSRRAKNFRNASVDYRRLLEIIKEEKEKGTDIVDVFAIIYTKMKDFLIRYNLFPGFVDDKTVSGILMQVERNVTLLKKDFWEAQNIAKRFKYNTREKITDYYNANLVD